jgi:DNA primase
VEEVTAKRFQLGYAPQEWHDLHSALVAQGFQEDDLLRAGLIRESTAKAQLAHDRFRGRIMFPFLDGRRRVAGFAGRILPAFEDGKQTPKYLNGPETPLFRKSHLLFGFADAAPSIRSSRRAILVEGNLDAIALAQAGRHETIAAGGTALTEHQLALLQRAGAEELVLLFDTDAPGLEASARIAPALLKAGLSTRVARLPGAAAADPDSFLRANGLRALNAVIEAGVPLTEWLLERAITARTAKTPAKAISVEQKLLIVRDLRPFVTAARPGLPRALFEQRIARRLELYIVALRAELARGGGRAAGGESWPG